MNIDALQAACARQDSVAVRRLAHNRAYNFDAAFSTACECSEAAVMAALLEVSWVSHFGGINCHALQFAARSNCAEVTRLLLADKRCNTSTGAIHRALESAITHGHVSVARVLLDDPRARPTVNHLHMACTAGNETLVCMLLPRVGWEETEGVMYSALDAYDNYGVVRMLLASGKFVLTPRMLAYKPSLRLAQCALAFMPDKIVYNGHDIQLLRIRRAQCRPLFWYVISRCTP